jgi:hypothetical protein
MPDIVLERAVLGEAHPEINTIATQSTPAGKRRAIPESMASADVENCLAKRIR